MEKSRRKVLECVRYLALLRPNIRVTCPHCDVIHTGNQLVPLEEPRDLFIYPEQPAKAKLGHGQKDVLERDKLTIIENIPKHPGATQVELAQSVQHATLHPLNNLWQRCVNMHNLSKTTRTFVWGAGSAPEAQLLFLGEAPGPQESEVGIPFIGPAGIVLSSAMNAAGISRTRDCLLINTTFYEPPRQGRAIGKPSTLELFQQRPRVMEVIRTMAQDRQKPLAAVVCLGKYAWTQLAYPDRLQAAVSDAKEVNLNDIILSKVKGWHTNILGDIEVPVLATYHPSFIMRIAKKAKQPSKVTEVIDYFNTFKLLKEKING